MMMIYSFGIFIEFIKTLSRDRFFHKKLYMYHFQMTISDKYELPGHMLITGLQILRCMESPYTDSKCSGNNYTNLMYLHQIKYFFWLNAEEIN